MIGIIVGNTKTYEVEGPFNSPNLVEGKLYYDESDGRIYYYSLIENRPNPRTGYFPIWDGKNKYFSGFANDKHIDTDMVKIDMLTLGSNINSDIAKRILYDQRKCDDGDILKPAISDEDNMFTQCIKGVFNSKEISMVDLVDMCNPPIPQKTLENYYIALNKITFMRMDKWNIWIDTIFHLAYEVNVSKDGHLLVGYKHPGETFDTGIVKYDNITKTKDDPFKKMVKILMIRENINKSTLKADDVDDYTINNMFTIINSNKLLSAQLFSRFIQMANLSYSVKLYDKDKLIFEFHE